MFHHSVTKCHIEGTVHLETTVDGFMTGTVDLGNLSFLLSLCVRSGNSLVSAIAPVSTNHLVIIKIQFQSTSIHSEIVAWSRVRSVRPHNVTCADVEAYFTVHSRLLQLPCPHSSTSEAVTNLAKKLSSIDSHLDGVTNIITKSIVEVNDFRHYRLRNLFHKQPRPFPESLLIASGKLGQYLLLCVDFHQHQSPKQMLWFRISADIGMWIKPVPHIKAHLRACSKKSLEFPVLRSCR
mmetsp:Transcript_8154/g.16588  ORF Transcript_8154/g.16588 Transcript_8154/m.16588 type:complete len:237 (-) Transcript_8154:138-848(-)